MISMMYMGESIYDPVFVCDCCGEPIQNALEAAAVYRRQSANIGKHKVGEIVVELGKPIDVLHVHKSSCLHQAEERLGGKRYVAWSELTYHVEFLLHNVGIGDIEGFQKLLKSGKISDDKRN